MKYFSKYPQILVSLLSFCLWGCHQQSSLPIVENGLLDLREYEIDTYEKIPLNGHWEMYWGELLKPRDFSVSNRVKATGYFEFPGSWNDKQVGDEVIPGKGYATFKANVFLDKPTLLALRVLTLSTSSRIFANGELVYEAGTVGKNRVETIPGYNPEVVVFPQKYRSVELIIQIANFDHRKGGPWQELLLGKEEVVRKQREWSIIYTIFLTGSILIVGIFQLVQYYLRRKERHTLYFSTFCFLIVLRLLSTHEYLIGELKYLSWEGMVKLEFISYYLSVAMFNLFVAAIFGNEYSKKVRNYFVGLSLLASALVVVTPSTIFTYSTPVFAVATFALAVYLLLVFLKARGAKREGARVFLYGYLILLVTFVNDVLYYNELINTFSLVGLGLYLFVFFQAFWLTTRTANAYEESESLAAELDYTNKHLEEMIEEKTKSLTSANTTLEYKNKQITSSIQYASRIQNAMLASDKVMKQHLPDHFILWKPRDVVSGDFYWFTETEGKVFLAAVDCTGHGVPGAFMSLIANEMLHRIVHQHEVHEPHMILKLLHENVVRVLKQHETHNRDGMDMALTVYIPDRKVVEFAGAKNPLVYIKRGEGPPEISLIKGNKAPVGGRFRNKEEYFYTKFSIPILDDTWFYMFSDGYADQFGGADNKKFSRARLKDIISSIHMLPMAQQYKVLNERLEEWMNPDDELSYRQMDDILVIGFKVRAY